MPDLLTGDRYAAAQRAIDRDWQLRLQAATDSRDVARSGAWALLLKLQASIETALRDLATLPPGDPLRSVGQVTNQLTALRARMDLYSDAALAEAAIRAERSLSNA